MNHRDRLRDSQMSHGVRSPDSFKILLENLLKIEYDNIIGDNYQPIWHIYSAVCII